MKRLILFATLAILTGCVSPNAPDVIKPILPRQSCYVIYAKHNENGTEQLLGPFYSADKPVTDWTSGDISFINYKTGRKVVIPGPGWKVNVTPGSTEIKPYKPGE